MVIDINAFLNEFEKEEINQKNQKNKNLDLDFQKDVEDKIYNLQSQSLNKDLNLLENFYKQIQNFQSDLPNKFLGINKKSQNLLNTFANNYSSMFVLNKKQNLENIKKEIEKYFEEFNKSFQEEDYIFAFRILAKIDKILFKFPTDFLLEKIVFKKRFYQMQNLFYKKQENIKHLEKKKIQNQCNLLFEKLKKSILLENYDLTKQYCLEVEFLINKIPIFNYVFMSFEKEKIYEILNKSYIFLEKKSKENYLQKLENINILFEKFHRNYINRNLNEVLLNYDRIVLEFTNLPDYSIEKKQEIFNKINQLYEKVNKLVLSQNIFMFLESFEYSKRIDAINNYLNHIEKSLIFKKENLEKLKEKIEKIPLKYYIEKKEILNRINKLLILDYKIYDKKKSDENSKNKNQNLENQNKIFQKKDLIENKNQINMNKNINKNNCKNRKINVNIKEDILTNKDFKEEKINNLKEKIKYEELKLKENELKKIKKLKKTYNFDNLNINSQKNQKDKIQKIKNKKQNKNLNINKNLIFSNLLDIDLTNLKKQEKFVLNKINNYFKDLQSTQNVEEFKKIYKNINFNLNLINLEKSKTKQIKEKIAIIFENKNFNLN